MKTKLAGWNKICKFTYVQSMKSKSMKVILAIMCIIAIGSMPVTTLLSGNSEDDTQESKTEIQKVYVYDDTGIIGQQFADKNITSEIYGHIQYVDQSDNTDIETLINREDNNNEVFLDIVYNDDAEDLSYGINVCVYYKEDSAVTQQDVSDFGRFVDENVKNAILKGSNTEEGNIQQILKDVAYEVTVFDQQGNVVEDESGINQFEYMFTIIMITVLIMIVSMVGSNVAELIVTEKSTKAMEYILTSVKPMAILVGKVAGSILMVMTMIGAVLASLVVSVIADNLLFTPEGGGFVLPSAITQIIENGTMPGLTPLNMIVIIILFILGYTFYGFLAGIAGATVSKIEEMAEGIKIFTFAMIIGAYLSLFLVMSTLIGGSDWGSMTYVVYLLPLSSIFILPQYLLFAKVSLPLVLGAIGVIIIAIILVVLFTNKVYEYMLYSNGAPMKIKDIFGLARNAKEGKNGK